MSDVIRARDLSPLTEDLSGEDDAWLEEVLRRVRADDHLVRLGEAGGADEEDYVVTRDAYGRWHAGRYIGDLALDGRRLEIRPRLGEVVIQQWLADALNLVAVPDTSAHARSDSFIARLMGAVWCRAVDQASRHGPPSFRRQQHHEGPYVRGRLELGGTARLRAAGSPHVASVTSRRDLENDVSRTLVAAERVLTARIGHDHWRTRRVDEILPSLTAAVGARPKLPSRAELRRIRYTPITRPFKTVADLSWRLAQLQGYAASSESGESEGLLVDVAELWELFVLRCFERALPDLRVQHGTRAGETTWLLESSDDARRGLGRLKPDVLMFDGGTPYAVAEAKYKRLVNRWPERPQGVDRGDLYQLTSYLARFAPEGQAPGLLLYPRDPEQLEQADAEAYGPWRTQAGGEVRFARLAVERDSAVQQLRDLFGLEKAARVPLVQT